MAVSRFDQNNAAATASPSSDGQRPPLKVKCGVLATGTRPVWRFLVSRLLRHPRTKTRKVQRQTTFSLECIPYLPLTKVLAGVVKIGIHEFRWDAEAAKNLDGKVTKVRVPTKDCTDHNE
jgi:hypothetical protein